MWLSYNDVLEVRNKLIFLYLKRDEYVAWGPLRIYPGIITRIHNTVINNNGDYPDWYYLKFVGQEILWDVTGPQGTPPMVVDVPFGDTDMAIVIKKLHQNFPYKPTDNYLQNNGVPIV